MFSILTLSPPPPATPLPLPHRQYGLASLPWRGRGVSPEGLKTDTHRPETNRGVRVGVGIWVEGCYPKWNSNGQPLDPDPASLTAQPHPTYFILRALLKIQLFGPSRDLTPPLTLESQFRNLHRRPLHPAVMTSKPIEATTARVWI